MKKEYWKPVVGYEGLYEVSNWGRVKSIKRIVKSPRGTRTVKERILNPRKDRRGYLYVILSKYNIKKTLTVHRLVALHFIDNPNNYPYVNHKDEQKDNNVVSNLEWCDAKYNSNYGTRNKKISEKMTNGKLSKPVLQYDLEGNLIREWASACECGRNGFDTGAVNACCNNKYKFEKYKNCFWKFKND